MPSVLLVDDEPLLRMALASELEDRGWQVYEAASGDDALKKISRTESIDVLVTDIVMPGQLDGWRLAEEIRKAGRDLPVIYMSGFSQGHRPLDKSVFLNKPFTADDLFKAFRELGIDG